MLTVAIILGSISGERVLPLLGIAILFGVTLWIESILLYGFGEIIEELETSNKNLKGLRVELGEVKKVCEKNA